MVSLGVARRRQVTAALCACFAIVVAAPTASARTVNVTESAQLELVRKNGSVLYEKGTATGTLTGKVTAQFGVTLTRVTGSVTFASRAGTLTFYISGYPTSTGTKARFAGSMTVTGGTGRYEGATGSATFTGLVNRSNWDASVRASGRISY